jgi:hypothetical protein
MDRRTLYVIATIVAMALQLLLGPDGIGNGYQS